MDWMFYTKIVAAIATIAILYILIKEISSSIKSSKNGEVSKKCDLD